MGVQQQNVEGSILSQIQNCKWRGMTMFYKANKVYQTKSLSRIEVREKGERKAYAE